MSWSFVYAQSRIDSKNIVYSFKLLKSGGDPHSSSRSLILIRNRHRPWILHNPIPKLIMIDDLKPCQYCCRLLGTVVAITYLRRVVDSLLRSLFGVLHDIVDLQKVSLISFV
jgi:hypothetical protein